MLPMATRVARSRGKAAATTRYPRQSVTAAIQSTHSSVAPCPAATATARSISTTPPLRLSRTPTPAATPAAFFSSHEHEADCAALKDIFDAPSSHSSPWSHTAAAAAAAAAAAPSTGLFGSPSLPSPDAFVPLAQRTLVRAQLLVHRIVSAPRNGEGEMRRVVKNLDRLSDILCGVIDLAELVRNAHPDAQWRDAANEAYEGLCGFMNVLNTHTGLYEVLRSVLQDHSLRSSLSAEALAVANVFLRDFEKSGIHLPTAQREKFVTLSDDILVLGRAFMQGEGGNGDGDGDGDGQADVHRADAPVRFKRQWFSSLNFNLLAALDESPALVRASTSSDICLDPALTSWEFPTILRFAPNPEARRIAYIAMNTSGRANVGVLERLLGKRAELANLTGYSSYAEMALGDKMAQKPESVDKFLRALESHHRPLALQKLEELKALQRKHASDSLAFEPWDRDFYAEHYLRSLALSSPGSNVSISSFFSVGNVFSGLSRMLSSLYGIRLRPAAMQPGEAWNSDVVKLDVVEEDGASPGGQAIIGTIYADLFSRAGKPPSAAHYTVRCSRRIDDDDADADFRFGRLPDGTDVSPEMGQRGGPASPLEVEGRRNPGRDGTYQTPVVVLLCDFVRPGAASASSSSSSSSSGGPSLLGWTEVETLFHEMGHALHSMVGRTEYHNVSGTRCATDFVELPSILMEHFLSSPAVLALVARHHATGAPLPYAHVERHLAHAKALDSLDAHNQILLALLDQRYHSARAGDPRFDSTSEMYDLHERHGLVPLDSIKAALSSSSAGAAAGGTPAGARSGAAAPSLALTWQGSFTHLFGYGASYYSYLFDRAIAARVWGHTFAGDPLSREAGERFKGSVLRWGGGRGGWEMLEGLGLGAGAGAGGKGERPLDMERVGEWGIETK